MDNQIINVAIPRSALKPEDFTLNSKGVLTIDKVRLNDIVKENIGVIPDRDQAAITVGVSVSW